MWLGERLKEERHGRRKIILNTKLSYLHTHEPLLSLAVLIWYSKILYRTESLWWQTIPNRVSCLTWRRAVAGM